MIVMMKKELRQLFGGVRGFAVIAILLLFCGLYTVFQNMLTGSPSFSLALTGTFPALITALPLLSAPSFATEKKCGTQGLLYSLSLRPSGIVFGKYFAHLTVFFLAMLVIALYPLLLSFFGTVEMAEAYFAWLGLFLLGASLLSVCLLLSTFFKRAWFNWGLGVLTILALYLLRVFLTELPSAAWFSFAVIELVLVGLCLFLWLAVGSRLAAACTASLPLGAAMLFVLLPDCFVSLVPRILSKINPFSRYAGFIYGRFDLQGILFFLCFTAFFLFLTVLITAYRRDDEF